MKDQMFLHGLPRRVGLACTLACIMPWLVPVMAILFSAVLLVIGFTMFLILCYMLILPVVVIFDKGVAKEFYNL